MGKNNNKKKNRPPPPPEEHLILPSHPSLSSSPPTIIDSHTHLFSTYDFYRRYYKSGKWTDVYQFVREVYNTPERNDRQKGHVVESILDVWCETSTLIGENGFKKRWWKEVADTALKEQDRRAKWGGVNYFFALGLHPHDAKTYSDQVEEEVKEAMKHERCVALGEIGLDYHYDHSPRDVQQEVLRRQLKIAVDLKKPLTIHTREADEDIERILKEMVPRDHKIHVHCFTDSPELAQNLLDHFPNLYIGITGVITYATNTNTSQVVRNLAKTSKMRIVLETDAPFMAPSNIYSSLTTVSQGQRLPLCHTGMIPWTAEFVANLIGGDWDAEKVMRVSRENVKEVYGF